MRRSFRWTTSAALLMAGLLPSGAQAIEVDVQAQYRPRAEVSERSLASATADQFVSHRARIGVTLRQNDWSLKLTPQHWLMWGTEVSTLSGASGSLDFHEAWGQWKKDDLQLRIGRQELIFDDHRLLGNVNWTQQARTFDAVRFDAGFDAADLTVFGALLEENAPRNRALWGGRAGFAHDDLGGSLVVLAEHAKTTANGDTDFWRLTPGLNANWAHEGLSLNLTSFVQAGKIAPGGATRESILAGMAALKVGYRNDTLGAVSVAGEYLSGDGDSTDDERHSFDTLFATNHKFYGYMDYFLNLPVQTGGLGLVDVWAGYRRELPKDASIYLNVHEFLAAAESAAGNRDFGTEVDLGVMWKIAPGVALEGGYSIYRAGDAFVDIGRAADTNELGHWAWAMLDVAFNHTFSSN